MLLGGSVAALHVTVYASHVLYDLTGYGVSFAIMVAANALAFGLAVRKDRASLSVLGTIGAYATPFVLETTEGTLAALLAYISTVVVSTAAIYVARRWQGLLLTSFGGAWACLFLVVEGHGAWEGNASGIAEAAIVLAWAALALGPAWLAARREANAPGPGEPTAHVAMIVAPFLALGASEEIWRLTGDDWGWITLAAAVATLCVSFGLAAAGGRRIAATVRLSSALLVTLAFGRLLEGDALFTAFAAEMLALHVLAARLEDRGLAFVAHAMSIVVACWLTYEFGDALDNRTALREQDAVDLVAIAGFAGAALVSRGSASRTLYGLLAHVALLAWFYVRLSPLESGQAFASIAWGVQAVAVLVGGFAVDRTLPRQVGLATLFALVAKLLVVDLAEVAAVWRILLFMGFGAVFLVLGYYLPRLAARGTSGSDTEA